MGFVAYGVFGFCFKHLLHFEKSLRKQKMVKYKVINIVSNIVSEKTYQMFLGNTDRPLKPKKVQVEYPLSKNA